MAHPSRSIWRGVRRKFGVIAAAGLLAVSVTTPAAASTDDPSTAADTNDSCLIGNVNNGDWWTAKAASITMIQVTWYEYGDYLTIWNNKSLPALGYLSSCVDGSWREPVVYRTQAEAESFSRGMAEGRRVRIKACRSASSYFVIPVDCSRWVYGNS